MGEIGKDILRVLENNPGFSDRELTDAVRGPGASSKYINQNCLSLEIQGLTIRKKRADGLMGNWLKGMDSLKETDISGNGSKWIDEFPEKRMKQILEDYLISQGWFPKIEWGYNHRVDIEAERGVQKWIIQVKGGSPPTPINSFVSILGEILQRMDEQTHKYSVALPDTGSFQRLWNRLPVLVKQRTGITALFVNPSGLVMESK
jgi:hypothetical protein